MRWNKQACHHRRCSSPRPSATQHHCSSRQRAGRACSGAVDNTVAGCRCGSEGYVCLRPIGRNLCKQNMWRGCLIYLSQISPMFFFSNISADIIPVTQFYNKYTFVRTLNIKQSTFILKSVNKNITKCLTSSKQNKLS